MRLFPIGTHWRFIECRNLDQAGTQFQSGFKFDQAGTSVAMIHALGLSAKVNRDELL